MNRIMTLAVAAVLVALPSCTVRTAGTAASGAPAGTEVSTSDSPAETPGRIDTLDDVEVGDCVEFLDRSPADVEVGTIDCAKPAAVYQVVEELPSPTAECPTGHYDYYTQNGEDEFTLCYMLNAREGDCFSGLWVGATGPERVNCTDPDANAKVTKILPGTVDESGCPAGTEHPTPYPVPPPGRTVCVTRP